MNTLTHYFVPQWIILAFVIVIPLPFVLIALFVRKETKKTHYKSAYPIVVSFFLVYLAYIVFASVYGYFNHVSLPPKVLLLTTFPFAFLLFVVVKYKSLQKHSRKRCHRKPCKTSPISFDRSVFYTACHASGLAKTICVHCRYW